MAVITDTGKYLVTVSNTLINASYSLSLVEKRLLMLFISRINNVINKEEGKEKDNLEIIDVNNWYSVSINDYATIYAIRLKTAKHELKLVVNKLHLSEVTYTNENNMQVQTNWISSQAKYNNKNHTIEIRWASDVIPIISQLRRDFTSYRLRVLSTLDSIYAIRYYELFISELNKQHKNHLKIILGRQEIHDMFKLGNNYRDFSDFRKRVIESPISKINNDKNCNINVSIHDEYGNKLYEKRGKEVVRVTFLVGRRQSSTPST